MLLLLISHDIYEKILVSMANDTNERMKKIIKIVLKRSCVLAWCDHVSPFFFEVLFVCVFVFVFVSTSIKQLFIAESQRIFHLRAEHDRFVYARKFVRPATFFVFWISVFVSFDSQPMKWTKFKGNNFI